ncbi:MAG: hypothetical protein ACR2OV_15805 [Hyphomicrobiaceae bacterium]
MSDIVSAAAGGLASGLAGSLFSSGPSVTAPLSASRTIPSFDFGGLSGRNQGGSLVLTPTQERLDLIGGVQGVLNQGAQQFANIRSQLRPGFGALTESRVGSLRDTARRSIGSLRQNLARRRLQGSSFASDAISRAEAEFGRQEADLRARSFLEELDATQNTINRELELSVGAIERGIAELDLQANLGTSLLAGITTQLGENARLQSQLAAESLAGQGAFFTPAIESIGSSVEDFVGGLLG